MIALVIAAAAGLSARSDRHGLVTTASTVAEAPLPGTAQTAFASLDRPDPFFDPSRSLAAVPVDFVAIGGSDALIDPAALQGPVPRPIGQRRPLQAALRQVAPRIVVAGLPAPTAQPPSGDAAQMVLASLPVQTTRDIGQSPIQAVPLPPGGDAQLPMPPGGDTQEAVEAVQAPDAPGADVDVEAQDTPLPPPAPREREVAEVPLPAPRPANLLAAIEPSPVPAPTVAPAPVMPPQVTRRTRMRTQPVTTADNRTFLERLLGGGQPRPAGQQLAYASTDTPATPAVSVRNPAPSFSLFSSAPAAGGGTAVYNISTRTVTLPNGERLEAHSGLGGNLDDPRSVSVKMRGVTPPSIYDLTEREAPFHGVRAIRLTPVKGTDSVYGRVGLLAHTYMLGPRGDSNGCVSFRDYNRFLQAYLRGEIKRLVVVAGT